MIRHVRLAIAVALLVLTIFPTLGAPPPALAATGADWPIPGGHFFTQANGSGDLSTGYTVVDDVAAPFWSAFQRLGGVDTLGYPVSRRFVWSGFLVQAFQKVVFQWRPEVSQVYFGNVFDRLSQAGQDPWLDSVRQTPPPFDTSPDSSLAWPDVVARHQALLTQNPAIRARYFGDSDPLQHFGLPMSTRDYGNVFVVRTQRAVFQQWQQDVPWAKAGEVVVANGGDIAKEAGLYPADAVQSEVGPAPTASADHFGVAAIDDPGSRLSALGSSWISIFGMPIPNVARQQVAQISLRPGHDQIVRVPAATLRAAARNNPGGYWLVGNEPNVPGQDSVSPAEFATELKYYADTIKGADPTARIVGPNALNWDFTCSGCGGITSGHVWIDGFRAAWASQFGGSPPIDVWGLHAYTISWDKLPMADAATVEQQIAGFADYLAAEPDAQPKPVWLTEFGVIWGFPGYAAATSGCAAAPSCIAPTGDYDIAAVSSFFDQLLGWLTTNVDRYRLGKWFVYTTYAQPEPYATAFGGIALLAGAPPSHSLSPLGQVYRRYIGH